MEHRSHRRKRVRQRTWSPEALQAVQELRELCPRWGKEKLAVLAARAGFSLSASTVGRMLDRNVHLEMSHLVWQGRPHSESQMGTLEVIMVQPVFDLLGELWDLSGSVLGPSQTLPA